MKEGRDPSAAAAAAAGAALRSLARNVPCGVGKGGTRDGAASACLPAWLAGWARARAVAASYVSEAQKMGRGCDRGHSEDGRGRAQCCCAAMMMGAVVKHPAPSDTSPIRYVYPHRDEKVLLKVCAS